MQHLRSAPGASPPTEVSLPSTSACAVVAITNVVPRAARMGMLRRDTFSAEPGKPLLAWHSAGLFTRTKLSLCMSVCGARPAGLGAQQGCPTSQLPGSCPLGSLENGIPLSLFFSPGDSLVTCPPPSSDLLMSLTCHRRTPHAGQSPRYSSPGHPSPRRLAQNSPGRRVGRQHTVPVHATASAQPVGTPLPEPGALL